MLILFLLWLIIGLVSLPFGVLTIKCLSFLFKKEVELSKISPDLILLLGFCSITVLASYLSLIVPINWFITAILLGLSIGYILKTRSDFQKIGQSITNSWKELKIELKILFGLLTIIVLISGAIPVFHYDFGLFQLQYLKWIQNYSVVPGLGNLDHRFSFNSHYFIPSALFSVIFSEEKVMCSLNSFFWLLLAGRLIVNINKAYKGKKIEELLFYTLILCSFSYFTLTHLSGLSTDILNSLLVCFTLISFLQLGKSQDLAILWILPLIVCVAITFKLSSALLILTLLFLLYRIRTWQYFFYLGISGLIICLPFLARNIILSGYLIFPFPPIDIFDVDWKVPMDVVVGEIANVKGWARVPYTKAAADYPISEWIGIWFANKGLFMKMILVVNTFLLIPIITLYRKQAFLKASILAICLGNLIFWFSQAPFPRYVHGFLFIGFAMTIAILASGLLKIIKLNTNLVYKGSTLMLFAVVLISTASFIGQQFNSSILFLGETCPKTEVKDFETSNMLTVKVPKGEDKRCFNAALPCTHHPEKTLSLRGESMAEGFKTVLTK